MNVFRIADLDIGGVKVTVVFGDRRSDWPLEEALRIFDALSAPGEYRSSEPVLIWKDNQGAPHFIASPQLHLFFERVSFDQLAAQVTREIAVA
jgi:hypothetical protein